MADSYEIDVFTQESIYNYVEDSSNFNRNMKVYFSIPKSGTNEDTGLLLLIAGFGGKPTSNVYKKMRDKLADEYNLVTIQCEYFGYEFMQSPEKILIPNVEKNQLKNTFTYEEIEEIFKNEVFNFDAFLNIGSKYSINMQVTTDLHEENINNFNDMGLLQCTDNLTAVLNVMNILYDNKYSFNSKKTIIYGHSHGAYLAYLCNAFAPNLFSLIIDNSAWLYPAYLNGNRVLYKENGNLTLSITFDYIAKKIIKDRELLNLFNLYSQFSNNCNIISYHGITDNLVSCSEKSDFCNKINYCMYNEISENDVDDFVFKSTNHGLNADFIKLYNYTMSNFNISFEKGTTFDLPSNLIYTTTKYRYIINYDNVIPKITIKEK